MGDNRAMIPRREPPPSAFLLPLRDDARLGARIECLLPLLLLGVAAVVSVANPQHSPEQRWQVIAYTLVSAAVIVFTDTAPPPWWRTRWWRVGAFLALLGCASVLTLLDPVFTVFTIAAFFRALVLRPKSVMLAGLAVTSALIHSLPGGGPLVALQTWPYTYLVIVVVQTAAVASGVLLSERLVAQSEERRALVAELRAAMEENAGLHQQLLVQARESGMLDERQRLSREIHDTLAQGLAGIITQLTAARQAGTAAEEAARRVDTALALARENLHQARRAVHALTPGELDGSGLCDALAAVTTRWAERSGIAAEFSTSGTVRALHPEIEATLLRVTQEALANVAKHARASRTVVTVTYLPDQVALDIRDDGVGFDDDPVTRADDDSWSNGYGIPGMRHRVQRIAGHFVVESERGAGTAISATVPAVAAMAEA